MHDVTCVEFRNGSTSNCVGEIMSTVHRFPALSLDDRLQSLHEEYVDAVNRAVAEDRDDVVEQLAAAYTDEAAALLGHELPTAA
jgi:hypothetical protein